MPIQTTDPAGTTSPAPATQTATTDTNPDSAQALAAEFTALHERGTATFGEVLSASADGLRTDKKAGFTEFEKVTCLMLPTAEQDTLKGKRYPEQPEVTLLFAAGLDKHPEIVAATSITPEILRTAAAQDQASVHLYTAGVKLEDGGGDGAILTSATVDTLCGRTLLQVKALRKDPHTEVGFRSDLEVAFAEPFRLRAEHQNNLQQTQTTNSNATRPFVTQRDQALQTAAETRLIDAFVPTVKAK